MNLLKDGVYGLNCFFTPMSKVENTCTHAKRLPYFRVRALYKRPRSLPYREVPRPDHLSQPWEKPAIAER